MWQRTAFVLPVVIFFTVVSNISYSSNTGESTNKALTLLLYLFKYNKKTPLFRILFWGVIIVKKQLIFTGLATRKENKDQEKKLGTKRQFKRGIGKFCSSCIVSYQKKLLGYSSKMHIRNIT